MINASEQTLDLMVETETLKVLVAHSINTEPAHVAGEEIDIEFFPTDTIQGDEPIGFSQIQPALIKAQASGAHLVFGTDEVNNRLFLAVRKYPDGAFQLMNIHQTALILASILSGIHKGQELFILKSVHVTNLLDKLAHKNDHVFKELPLNEATSLKEQVNGLESDKIIFAVSENQEFAGSPHSSIYDLMNLLIKEEQRLRKEGKTLLDSLMDLYKRYGFYLEKVFTVDLKTEVKEKHFEKLMDNYRRTPPDYVGFHKLQQVMDFKKRTIKNIESRKSKPFETEVQDMIRFTYSENLAITLVPQKNKMLFYISINGVLAGNATYQDMKQSYNLRMIKIIQSLNSITQ